MAFYEVDESVLEPRAVFGTDLSTVQALVAKNGAPVIARDAGTTTTRTLYPTASGGTPLSQPVLTVNGRIEAYVQGETSVDFVVNYGQPNQYTQRWTPPQKDMGVTVVTAAGGSGDDTATLNNALASGGVVWLHPTATYQITGTLQIPSRTRLMGHGGGVIKAKSSMPNTTQMIQNSNWSAGQTDIGLSGVEVDGNKANRSGAQTAQIEFRGNASTTRAKRLSVTECYLHDTAGPALAFQNGERLRVRDNDITGADRDGVLCQANVRDVVIDDNRIGACDDDHIGVHSGPESANQSQNVVITGNVLNCDGATAGGNGIAVNGIDGFSVTDNVIWRAVGSGLLASNHDAFDLRDGVIAGNVISDSGYVANAEGFGMLLGVAALGTYYYSTTATANFKNIGIYGNAITGSAKDGIRIRSNISFSAVRLIDNDSTLNGGYGLLNSSASGLTVALNDFRNNTSGAISGAKAAGDVYLVNRGDIPTVTGSRGGNAALASLLSTLAAAGVVVDSSS